MEFTHQRQDAPMRVSKSAGTARCSRGVAAGRRTGAIAAAARLAGGGGSRVVIA